MKPNISLRLPALVGLCAFFLAAVSALRAHGHIDVRPDTISPSKLALVGSSSETMLHVPPGEPFSFYAPSFPGGYYACELTISHEDPDGSSPSVQLLSVAGPAGALFGFWEAGALTPIWSRPSGWTATHTDRPAFHTDDQGGYGHIHGRVFTATHPGTYTIAFRVADEEGLFQPSEPKTVTFNVLATPQLSLRIEAGSAILSFASRAGLTYDLQVSTDLHAWANVSTHRFLEGTGSTIELTDPLADRPRVFYRLVEYF
jgi:hypothetical protein